ncbi:hypothetical protein MKX07_004877 [Trichoderma sp. CBMAI-0711]|nr:hypothetical protein MKX07_004877 [Trichoderma sp. CBMAI-0711]
MTASIPSVQTAALIRNPGPNAGIEIRHDYPVPQPGKNEVLLKMECSGICYSDIYVYTGNNPHYNEVPCHEGVGKVIQLGPDVADRTLLGQRVGLGWIYSVCGQCYNCAAGRNNWCVNQANTGTDKPGTMQQYVVANADYLMPIPDDLSSSHAAPFLCGGVTMAGALSLCDDALADGDTLVISEDVIQKVMELTNGKGADAAIVVPAATEAFDQALQYLKITGTMICAGITRMDYRLPVSPTELEYRGLVLKGCHVGTENQLKQLLISAAKKEVVPHVEIFEFEKTGELFERIKHGDAMSIVAAIERRLSRKTAEQVPASDITYRHVSKEMQLSSNATNSIDKHSM